MQQNSENQLVLPHVTVQLTTVMWQGIEETPAYSGYNLSQGLSDNPPPVAYRQCLQPGSELAHYMEVLQPALEGEGPGVKGQVKRRLLASWRS